MTVTARPAAVTHRPNVAWLGRLEGVTRRHWSWAATIAIGSGHAVWIGLEVLYLPEVSMLQLGYGLGIALFVLPLLAGMRGHLSR